MKQRRAAACVLSPCPVHLGDRVQQAGGLFSSHIALTGVHVLAPADCCLLRCRAGWLCSVGALGGAAVCPGSGGGGASSVRRSSPFVVLCPVPRCANAVVTCNEANIK